jgi:tol-pal system protein YbgF
MSRALGVLVVTAVLATGCASRGAVNRLTADAAELRAQLTEARAAQELTAHEIERTQAELRAMDARTRELRAGVSTTSEELARLAGRMDAADETIRKTRARVDAIQSPPAESRAEPRGDRTTRPGTPEQAYAAVLATFRAREHGQAVLDFLDFIKGYPKHPLAANARYWIGEAYYVQRDYRQALREFQKVLELGSGKVPDALVKIGLCYWSLREPVRARATWQKVVREHPGAAPAGIARSLLKKYAAVRR